MEYFSHPNAQTVSAQTQTDYSFIFLQERLQRKELQIRYLQNQIQLYKQQLESFQKSLSSNKLSPRTSVISETPELIPTPKSKPFASDPKIMKISKMIRNSPLDTITIQELSNSSPKNNTLNPKRASPETHSLNPRRKMPRIKKSTEHSALPSKKSSKSSHKLDSSLISELVYNDSQNRQSWNDLLTHFRKDPGLLKFALDKKDRYYCYFDLTTQKPPTNSQKRSRLTSESRSRPRTVKSTKIKNLNLDWSKSELDELVIQGVFKFQAENGFYSGTQIEELLQEKEIDLEEVYFKSFNTLEKLKTELMLPKGYLMPVGKTKETVEKVLNGCLMLFKVRALVVKILRVVHAREDLMLKLIAGGEESCEELFAKICKMNQEIVQIIAFLKHCRFPISRFVYLGEDLQEKIVKDNENLMILYPDLENLEVFEDSY